MTDFKTVVRTLADGGVEFIVVGGFAAVVHGSARVTFDVDVVYRRSTENIARLVLALTPYHPYLRGAPPGLPFRWDAATVQHGLNFTLKTDIGDVDLLGEDVVRVHRAADPLVPTPYRRGQMAEAKGAVPGWRFPVDELFE